MNADMNFPENRNYIVRVSFKNKFKFLKLKECEVDWKTFIDKGKARNFKTHNKIFKRFFLMNCRITTFQSRNWYYECGISNR